VSGVRTTEGNIKANILEVVEKVTKTIQDLSGFV
jgi:hypothetical protein